MGKRGPAPKPTALRLLHGDRKDRVNDNEPTPAAIPIEPPPWLDADALEVWQYFARDHFAKAGVSHWDVPALAVLCTAIVHYQRAARLVNDTGVLIKARGDKGGVVKHPAMQILRDQAAIIRAYAGEFGLTPSSRSALVRPGEPSGSTADRLLS